MPQGDPVQIVSNSYIDLPLIIHIAQTKRSDIRAQEKITEKQKAKELSWLSKHFPQISLNYTAQKSQKNVLPEQQLQLSLKQALFAPGSVYFPYQLARIGTKSSICQTEYQKQQAQLSVEQTFFDLQNNYAKNDLELILRETGPEVFKKAQIQFENGLISTVDLEQQKSVYTSTLSTIEKIFRGKKITKNESAITSEQKIKRKTILWMPLETIKQTVKKLVNIPKDELYTQALHARPDLKLLAYAMEQAEIQEKIYASQYLPSASFFASMYATRKAETLLGAAEEILNYPWTLGLSVSWNFDSLTNMFEVRASRAEYLSQMLKKKRSEWVMKKEIDLTVQQLAIDQATITEAEQIYQHGQQAFEKKQLEVEAGLAAPLELLQAKADWEQIQANYTNAHTNAAKNCALLHYKTGHKLEYPILAS